MKLKIIIITIWITIKKTIEITIGEGAVLYE